MDNTVASEVRTPVQPSNCLVTPTAQQRKPGPELPGFASGRISKVEQLNEIECNKTSKTYHLSAMSSSDFALYTPLSGKNWILLLTRH